MMISTLLRRYPNLRHYLSLLLLLTLPLAITASATEFSVSLLERFASAQASLSKASDKYPELADDMNLDLLFKNQGQGLVEQAKTIGAYPEMQSIVKKNGFASLSEYVALMSRLMAAQMAVEIEKHPSDELDKVADMDITEMRKSMLDAGLSEAMVDMQLEKIEQSMAMVKSTRDASQAARPEDIAFVKANAELVAKAFE